MSDYDFSIIDDTFPSIPLSTFMSVYAPLLSLDDPEIFNGRWLFEVAKSFSSFVYLTDQKGEVVDVVPPLRTACNISDTLNGNSLMYIEYESLRDERFGNAALANVLDVSTELDKEKASRLVLKWREFLERNKIKVNYVDEVPTISKNNNPIMDIDIEWETV